MMKITQNMSGIMSPELLLTLLKGTKNLNLIREDKNDNSKQQKARQ